LHKVLLFAVVLHLIPSVSVALNTGPDSAARLLPPRIKRLDRSPVPVSIKVPSGKGGSYIINYATGPVKVDLEPPGVTPLPVGRETGTGTAVANPEAQGVGFFTTFTTDNGLALDGVTDIMCDKRGFLWICTSGGGVSRYDGKSFVNYTTSQGLANNSVWCVSQDRQGNIWFGTQAGASKYDGRSFSTYTVKQGLANNIVRVVYTDRKGYIWFGTNGGGVSRYDGKSFTSFSVKEGLAFDYIYDITEDREGNIWFATVGGGVSEFDGRQFKNFNSRQGLAGDVVVSTCVDSQGNLWFGTYGAGVSKFDGRTFTTFNQKDGLGNNTVWRMFTDNENSIWFGTDGGGVTRFDGRSFTGFSLKQGLTNNTVWGIAEDQKGNLWFGTLGGGLSRYNGKSFTNFTTAQGLGNNLVRSIAEDDKGDLWFGTDQGGVTKYDGRSFTRFSIPQGLSNETVWSAAKDNKGNLWFGTAGGGVFCFNGSSFTNYTTDQGLANTIIRSIFQDSRGNMWFGSWLGGVSKFDGSSFTTYTREQGLPDNSIMDIAEDKNGNLWFGTYGGGVSVFDGSVFLNMGTDNGLINNNVKCLTPDNKGRMWIGTEGGISLIPASAVMKMFSTGRVHGKDLFTSFTSRNGLPDNSVTGIIQTRKGEVYAGTNMGICEIIDDGEGGLRAGNHYYTTTGYPVKDINAGFCTIFEDSRGVIWAGTGSDHTGLMRFNPGYVRKDNTPPDVVIESIKVNNESIAWHDLLNGSKHDLNDSLAAVSEEYLAFGHELGDRERAAIKSRFGRLKFSSISRYFHIPENLVVPHGNNNITIEFNAVDPGRHQMVRYSYFMEGYDKDWSPATGKTTAVYGNIFEGSYTFRVKAMNPDGIWSEPVEYKFRVLPPWYRTWMMYVMYAVVLAGGLYAFYRWRVEKLRKENLVLEEKVRLRTAELQRANEEIEAQKNLVTKQKEHIEEIHKEVTDSIHYARRLQTSAIPVPDVLSRQFSGLFILFRPKDVVSGDFYWYAVSGRTVIFTVADCTGHGVPGAFMSMLGISLLKEIVIKSKVTDPGQILNLAREEIIRALGQTGASGEQKDGMDITLCSVDLDTLMMKWAGANLPCYIVRDEVLTELKGDKMPIAIYERMDSFTTREFQLMKGDQVFLSGDGYHDQFGGPDGKKFMSKRFKELLVSISKEPMEGQKAALEATVEQWQNAYSATYPQTDDITVMGIRI